MVNDHTTLTCNPSINPPECDTDGNDCGGDIIEFLRCEDNDVANVCSIEGTEVNQHTPQVCNSSNICENGTTYEQNGATCAITPAPNSTQECEVGI